MNQITRQMVLAKHQEIAKAHGEVTASNVMRHLRSVYNFIPPHKTIFRRTRC